MAGKGRISASTFWKLCPERLLFIAKSNNVQNLDERILTKMSVFSPQIS